MTSDSFESRAAEFPQLFSGQSAHHTAPNSSPGEPEVDPRFVFDFEAIDDLDSDHQRFSTWLSVEPLCRGPKPRPDWVVTSQAAIDTELGILKTGKEADVFLVERAVPGQPGAVMAAKRYRSPEHRTFHRNASYTEGRSQKRSRDNRAVKNKSTWGRLVAAGQWANFEWEGLRQAWEIGIPVPYPVQIDGTEILMEWISLDGETAPRLAQTRPTARLLRDFFEQVRSALAELAGHGLVHGDLSAYNILARDEQLVIIDLPQMINLVGNPQGMDYLLRDCANICAWFRGKGLDQRVADEQALFGELIARAL